MSFLTENQLKEIGFRKLGKQVKISDKTSIYNPGQIEIDDFTRIDDFCILSAGKGGIKIGRHVHIACYCSLIGDAPIVLGDFSGISSRTAIYSSSDDYSGEFMTNPTIPDKYKNVISGPVVLGNHVIIGAGCVVLPDVTLGTGCAVGALSLVSKSFDAFSFLHGIPAKFLKRRSDNILALEADFLRSENNPERTGL